MTRPRSSYTPPAAGRYRPPSVLDPESQTRWKRWPGHAAVAKPPCTGAPGCKGAAATWVVCACGQPFAACNDHLRDVIAERDAHAKTCAGARRARR